MTFQQIIMQVIEIDLFGDVPLKTLLDRIPTELLKTIVEHPRKKAISMVVGAALYFGTPATFDVETGALLVFEQAFKKGEKRLSPSEVQNRALILMELAYLLRCDLVKWVEWPESFVDARPPMFKVDEENDAAVREFMGERVMEMAEFIRRRDPLAGVRNRNPSNS